LPLTPELSDMMPGHLKDGQLKFVTELAVADDDHADKDFASAADDVAKSLDASLERAGFGGLVSVVAVVPGAETGVRLCDHLQESVSRLQAESNAKAATTTVLSLAETAVTVSDVAVVRTSSSALTSWTLKTNGSSGSEARREKYVMGEKVRAAGVRAVKQFRAIGDAAAFAPVQAFLSEHWPPVADDAAESNESDQSDEKDGTPPGFLAVVKPLESAGSDGVTACRSFTEVHAAVKKLVGAINGLGQVNEVCASYVQ
jgi:hypothetical protein